MSGRRSSAPQGSERLAARRRRRRRRVLVALCAILILFLAGAAYGLRQNAVRISHIQVFGADQSLAGIAARAMQGYYLGVIPRDSIFFFPEERIREDILAARREIAAVSMFRNGLNGLSIKVDNRTPIARWCGLGPTEGVEAYCYVFDAHGVIYAAAASATQTVNVFTVYAPLAGAALEPLGATLENAAQLPEAFDFARQLSAFGVAATAIVVRDGEVSDYLASGTRITYVLGAEQPAFSALVSSRGNLNFADGSIDYVDLRFDGKVYLKKK